MSEDLTDPGFRIDLSATGKLTMVRTDGALWYLVICQDVRIMCVTYQQNGMKVGDVVKMQGAYQRSIPITSCSIRAWRNLANSRSEQP